MTGYSAGASEQDGGKGFDVLNKPFSADELLAKARLAYAERPASHSATQLALDRVCRG